MEQTVQAEIKKVIIDATINEFTQQGHHFTGGFESKLECMVDESYEKTIFTLYGAYYGSYLDKGVKRESISFKMFPFVLKYAMKRMDLEEKKAKPVAAAIINKWKKEGMPTMKSYSHSKNGERKNFIERSFEAAITKIDPVIEQRMYAALDAAIVTLCKNINTMNR